MGAHIFLVGEENFEVCASHGVYGCVMPTTAWNKAEIVAGVLSIQPGDLVFFYVKNRGVFGLWRVVSEPYFDETKVWANDQQLFPYRFSFEPAVGYFPKPVSLSDVLDLRDKGRVWTFDLNPANKKTNIRSRWMRPGNCCAYFYEITPSAKSHEVSLIRTFLLDVGKSLWNWILTKRGGYDTRAGLTRGLCARWRKGN